MKICQLDHDIFMLSSDDDNISVTLKKGETIHVSPTPDNGIECTIRFNTKFDDKRTNYVTLRITQQEFQMLMLFEFKITFESLCQ